jgi:hypothetical protein
MRQQLHAGVERVNAFGMQTTQLQPDALQLAQWYPCLPCGHLLQRFDAAV